LVTRNYWWPGVIKEVKTKHSARKTIAIYISGLYYTKLSKSRDHDSILVAYDRFLKILHFIVMTEKITAEGLVRLFRNNVWKLHRLPESVILDRFTVCCMVDEEVK